MKDILRIVFVVFIMGMSCGFSQNKKELLQEITINFDNGSSVLTQADLYKLTSAIKNLKGDKALYTVEIAAHTDSNGSTGYNNELSARRAVASAGFFIENGFRNRKIRYTGQGEMQPAADNISENGRAKNRRATAKIYLDSDAKNIIGGFTIHEKTYTIDASRPQELAYESGTVINIPEDAFVDKKGNPVVGMVQLSYIEYRDPVDFILGNIPMDHTENGQRFHFNSAGMFKILAYKNQEELQLDKDKNISIDFVKTQNLPRLNFYEFDQNKNQWEERRKLPNDSVAGSSKWIDVGYFAEEESYDSISGNNTRTIEANNYDNQCQQWYRNISFAEAVLKNSKSLYDPLLFVSADSIRALDNKRSVNKIKLKKAKSKEATLTGHQKKLGVWCRVENSPDAEASTFILAVKKSGMKSLKKIVWEGNSKTLKTRNDSIVLTQIEKAAENEYRLHFRDHVNYFLLENIKIAASVNETEKTSTLKHAHVVLASFDKKEERIQTIVDKQREELATVEAEKAALQKIAAYSFEEIQGIRSGLRKFWEFNKPHMEAPEKNLEWEKWLLYFDNNPAKMTERFANLKQHKNMKACLAQEAAREKKLQQIAQVNQVAQNVTESLNISKLGIYNCDQLERLEQPLIVHADYENEQGQKIVPLFIYVIDKKINGILRYDGYDDYGPERFAFSPKSETTLLAFDGEGNAYIYTSEKMKRITASSKQNRKKLVVSQIGPISGKQQLTAMLN